MSTLLVKLLRSFVIDCLSLPIVLNLLVGSVFHVREREAIIMTEPVHSFAGIELNRGY